MSIESRSRRGNRRRGRPRRPHRRHRREHSRLDQRHQGRRRLSGEEAACALRVGKRARGGDGLDETPSEAERAKRPQTVARRLRLLWLTALVGLSVYLYSQPLASYFETRNDLARDGRRWSACGSPRRGSSGASSTRRASRRPARGEADRLRASRASSSSSSRASRSGEGAHRSVVSVYAAMDDRAIVARQLGRPPRALRRVVVRCPYGLPGRNRAGAVRRGRRALPDDLLPHVPAPRLRARAARSGGRSRALEPRRSEGRRARARRSSGRPTEQRRVRRELAGRRAREGRGRRRSSSGSRGSRSPGRLKCLHAHAAFALARPGYALGERILAEVDPLWPSDRCCSEASRDRRTSIRARDRRRREREARLGGRLPPVPRKPREIPPGGRPACRARGGDGRAATSVSAPRSRSASSPSEYRQADVWARAACRRAGRRPAGRDAVDRRGRGVPSLLPRRGRLRAVTMLERPSRDGRARPQRREPVGRSCCRGLLLVLAFLLGIAFARTLDEQAEAGGAVTNVRTLTPLPQDAAGAHGDRDGDRALTEGEPPSSYSSSEASSRPATMIPIGAEQADPDSDPAAREEERVGDRDEPDEHENRRDRADARSRPGSRGRCRAS